MAGCVEIRRRFNRLNAPGAWAMGGRPFPYKTSSAGGSAIVSHSDRIGLQDTRNMTSWSSSHGSRGCSQDQLKASGGAGLFHCFVAN